MSTKDKHPRRVTASIPMGTSTTISGTLSGGSVSGSSVTYTPPVGGGTTNLGTQNQNHIWIQPNTYTPGTTTTPYTATPGFSWAPSAIMKFNTDHGEIEIHMDGHIVLPEGISQDEALKELWQKLQEMGRHAFEAAVRKEAAKAVREHLPRLLPDLDEYQKAFLPGAIATAIETSKN
jgi:hypothetical protein